MIQTYGDSAEVTGSRWKLVEASARNNRKLEVSVEPVELDGEKCGGVLSQTVKFNRGRNTGKVHFHKKRKKKTGQSTR